MDKSIIDERKRKVDIIANLLESRDYRQEDIAKKLGIPVTIVQKVAKELNYNHTIHTNKDNRRDGQMLNMVVDPSNMPYLDEYYF